MISLMKMMKHFANDQIGCVSGEDHIGESSGEGLYGRYELALRNLESEVYSIVGASGSFYSKRRAICDPFPQGMAPDFYSVLVCVEKGYRAVTEPSATGTMIQVNSNPTTTTRARMMPPSSLPG